MCIIRIRNIIIYKKENIGLIEVMGLAVLPARLQKEMAELERRILQNEDLRESDLTKITCRLGRKMAAKL